MRLTDKQDKGKELFIRLRFWHVVTVSLALILGIVGSVWLIWDVFIRRLSGGIEHAAFLIFLILGLAFIAGLVLNFYYFVKSASHLGINSYLQKNILDTYKEMRQIAKEKKWI